MVARIAVAILLLATALRPYAPDGGTAFSPPQPVGSGTGLVSASHPLAAEAGAEILRRGGNAIDAAVAVQLALNVVEPQFSGIGGGGFMLIHPGKPGGQTVILDGRETAPAAATPDQFLGVDGRPLPFAEAHV